MRDDEIASMAYFSSGELNVSFVLSNANLLLKEGELDLAASLFRLVAAQEKHTYCGFYGLGQFFLKRQSPNRAVVAFEKALSLSKRPFIALALLNALIEAKEFSLGEARAMEFARDFANDANCVEEIRRQYQRCLLEKRESSRGCN